MDALIHSAFAYLGGLLTATGLTVYAIVKHPDLVERWAALIWKLCLKIGIFLRFAHKKYVQYDFQGHVNHFIKKHSKELPGFHVTGVRMEWVDTEVKRSAFIDKDEVVIRIRRQDPHHENFVNAVVLFVSNSLLFRAKRYLSPSQGEAVDLFVVTTVLQEEKPEIVDYYLEEYLHPKLDDAASKIGKYFERFDTISKAGLFFPVFLQEMDYLGQKVFGTRRGSHIVTEVDDLVEFLEALSLRRVGEEQVELNFVKQYCRFAVVIVGKRLKLEQSITPYVNFIRNKLNANIETVYLLGRVENVTPIKEICAHVKDQYEVVAERKLKKILRYGDENREIHGFVAVLRSKKKELFVPSKSPLSTVKQGK